MAASSLRIFRQHILEKSFQFSQMLACGRMNDDSPIFTIAVNFSHAKSMPFEPPPDLGSPKSNVQLFAFDIVHGRG